MTQKFQQVSCFEAKTCCARHVTLNGSTLRSSLLAKKQDIFGIADFWHPGLMAIGRSSTARLQISRLTSPLQLSYDHRLRRTQKPETVSCVWAFLFCSTSNLKFSQFVAIKTGSIRELSIDSYANFNIMPTVALKVFFAAGLPLTEINLYKGYQRAQKNLE